MEVLSLKQICVSVIRIYLYLLNDRDDRFVYTFPSYRELRNVVPREVYSMLSRALIKTPHFASIAFVSPTKLLPWQDIRSKCMVRKRFDIVRSRSIYCFYYVYRNIRIIASSNTKQSEGDNEEFKEIAMFSDHPLTPEDIRYFHATDQLPFQTTDIRATAIYWNVIVDTGIEPRALTRVQVHERCFEIYCKRVEDDIQTIFDRILRGFKHHNL